MTSFHGWGSIDSWLVKPLRGGLFFPTKFSEIPGTHSWYSGIYLRKKPGVYLGATQWFSSWDPWIGNPAS